MNTLRTIFVACLLVASVVVPVGGAVAQQDEAYAGTHVSFETTSNAVVDYAVDGATVVESVEVQSQSAAQSQGAVSADAGLSAVTDVAAAPVSVGSQTDLGATVSVDSGASIEAHDNPKGVLVVRAGGESQYVTANLSDSTEASAESDERVVVTRDDGTQGAFLVVGDGSVTVNDAGDVSADIANDGRLVFRSYPQERSESDRKQERLITDGAAAAEVYVVQRTEDGGELAADVVQYGEGTTVEVTERSEGRLQMTADRSQSQGRVVITTVSEEAISSVDDLSVTVDGEAAVEASSYSDLRSATDGADSSKFLVHQRSSAEANADVLVAVNHFSERQITMQDGDGSSDGDAADTDDSGDANTDDSGAESTSGNGPGFGVVVALVALLAAVAAVGRRD